MARAQARRRKDEARHSIGVSDGEVRRDCCPSGETNERRPGDAQGIQDRTQIFVRRVERVKPIDGADGARQTERDPIAPPHVFELMGECTSHVGWTPRPRVERKDNGRPHNATGHRTPYRLVQHDIDGSMESRMTCEVVRQGLRISGTSPGERSQEGSAWGRSSAPTRGRGFAGACHDASWTPYLPHSSTDPELAGSLSPETVMSKDLRELDRADVAPAYGGETSLGVGAEIAIAISRGTQILAIYESPGACRALSWACFTNIVRPRSSSSPRRARPGRGSRSRWRNVVPP